MAKETGEEVSATITNVEIRDVQDVWRKKPSLLKFNDTDLVIVTAKTGKKEVRETFFTCIKPNGTFKLWTPNKVSRLRREKLASFMRHYLRVRNPENYNLKEKIKEWKGKKVKVDKEGYIVIP